MRPALRPVLLATALAAVLGACASKPKPAPESLVMPTPQAEAELGAAPGVGPAASAPGGQEDLAATAGDRVFFALDSHELSPDARATLERQAAWLARHPSPVLIAGNADERGTREYNLALGARRAEAVRSYLAARGVPLGQMRTVSYGKERPIDPRSNEEGWSVNRNAHTGVTGAP